MICRVIPRAAACGIVLCCAFATSAPAVTSPRDGGPIPATFFESRSKDATAFMPKHAWLQKERRLREARRAFVIQHGPAALSAAAPGSFALTGTMNVPVLPGYFSGEGAEGTRLALENQLFDSNPTGTLSQYYNEVSYNQFSIGGDVFAWQPLVQTGGYYAGTPIARLCLHSASATAAS
jgi:hypothetical protein